MKSHMNLHGNGAHHSTRGRMNQTANFAVYARTEGHRQPGVPLLKQHDLSGIFLASKVYFGEPASHLLRCIKEAIRWSPSVRPCSMLGVHHAGHLMRRIWKSGVWMRRKLHVCRRGQGL